MRVHSSSIREFEFCPSDIPDGILNELTALQNHNQTLARLNERGGMGVLEFLDNIHRRKLSKIPEAQEHVEELKDLVLIWRKKQMPPDPMAAYFTSPAKDLVPPLTTIRNKK